MAKKISCRRCGECAKTSKGIRLNPKELNRLRKSGLRIMTMPHALFPGRIGRDKQGYCVGLERSGKTTKCKVYSKRPDLCRQYPLRYFNGRGIIEKNCTAAKELLAEGITSVSREEIEKNPFLAKSLAELEAEFPQVKKQQKFEITDR